LYYIYLSEKLAKRHIACARVSRHFGPKTFRHHCDGAEVSGHFRTGAEESFGNFGTSAEMSGHFGTIMYCLFTKRKLHTHC